MKRKLSSIVGLLLFLALIVVVNQMAVAAPDAPASLANWQPPQWLDTQPGKKISTLTTDATLADIAYSGSGARLMIVYNQKIDATNSDPWFSVSTANGSSSSWSAPQLVRSSVGVQAQNISLAFTGETAHAAWVEYNPITFNYQLISVSETSPNNWGQAKFISTGLFPGYPMFEPELVARGNRLHVVWAEGLPQKLYHAWSDGGGSWSTPAVVSNLENALESDIAIDSNGYVHVVWTKVDATTNIDVYYARSTNTVTPYNWSTPVPVSMDKQDSHPSITENGGLIRIAFTRIDANNLGRQHIVYTQCSNNCTSASGWVTPYSLTLGEGYVGANDTSPTNVIADMIDDPGKHTAYIYFHGFNPLGTDNEVLWGVNDCQYWSVRDTPITDQTNQSLRPSIAIHGSNLQLVYEQIPSGGGASQIYHRRATIEFCPYRIQLPILFK